MQYNWNWGILLTPPYSGWLASGLAWTVLLSSAAWVIGLCVGSLVGIGRALPSAPIRALAGAYVEVFRNIPPLVQMFLWFFVVPGVLPKPIGRWMVREMFYPEFTTAVVCLGLYTAAKVAEQVRSGITSVARGLASAAYASGLRTPQVYRYILIPMAFRIIVPPLTSELLGLFKNSSLALTIGMLELTGQSRQIESFTFQTFEAYTAATILYLAVNGSLLIALRRIEPRLRVPGAMGRTPGTVG